ncbi:MAG: glutamate--tRNA ligase, partial [Candidatus Nanopelagicales bacterium]
SEESYQMLLDSLRWLGLDWDEGPEVGGPYGPYRQSQRMDIYADVAQRLVESGHAYPCYCTAEELEAEREKARAEGRAQGYVGTCRHLTAEERAAREAEGRSAVIRFAMPEHDYTWDDLVRGEITFARDNVPDYVIVRANGDPLYTLVNPVDDALMRISHVLRGEDLLSSTPRQIAMYAALADIGVGDGGTPRFGHLPYVMGEGNKKLSKRDPESSLLMYREEGYLPEGLLNYLALLGWSMGDDQEFFSPQQMAAAFEVSRVSPNPARFDLKKCTAINGDWIRSLTPEDLAERIIPFLAAADLVGVPLSPEHREVLEEAVPLVQERMETLKQAVGMLGFLFIDDDSFTIEEGQSVSDEASQQVIGAAIEALSGLAEWKTVEIEAALRSALIEGLGLKPKVAFGAVRVAVTGRKVSPPLFESMEILGRNRSLSRLAAARVI